MFIGHFAAGLAAKKFAPKVSLGVLFIACQLLDLLWPVFLLLGIEHAEIEPGNTVVTPLNFTHYPYSHSLLFVLGWSLLLASVYFLRTHRRKDALIVGALVLSHWVLDLIVHRPDLPLFPSSELFGFGLWNNFLASVLIEAALFSAGVILYARATAPLNKAGRYLFPLLAAVLISIYAANLFGPPPPNMKMVAIAGNLMWLFVFLAYWADRNRKSKTL